MNGTVEPTDEECQWVSDDDDAAADEKEEKGESDGAELSVSWWSMVIIDQCNTVSSGTIYHVYVCTVYNNNIRMVVLLAPTMEIFLSIPRHYTLVWFFSKLAVQLGGSWAELKMWGSLL